MKKKKLFFLCSICLPISIYLIIYISNQINREKIIGFSIFNIQGSQIVFIRTPNDKRILINSGTGTEIMRYITRFLPFYSRKIDYLFAVDNKDKNIEGLINIIDRFRVEGIFIPAIDLTSLNLASTSDQAIEVFKERAKEKDIKVESLLAGEKKEIDENVFVDILFPAQKDDFQYSRASAPLLLVQINSPRCTLLFLDKASKKIQKYITEKFSLRESFSKDFILVMGNSANSDQLSSELIKETNPNYLIYYKKIAKQTVILDEKSAKPKIDPLSYLENDKKFNTSVFSRVQIGCGEEVSIRGIEIK